MRKRRRGLGNRALGNQPERSFKKKDCRKGRDLSVRSPEDELGPPKPHVSCGRREADKAAPLLEVIREIPTGTGSASHSTRQHTPVSTPRVGGQREGQQEGSGDEQRQ